MHKQTQTFAIVTPSYVLDFERCALLASSIQRFVPAEVLHYIIVERRDEALFKQLESQRTRILLQEDLIKVRALRLRKWRLSWGHVPVRGWIWQQLVKLSVAGAIDADAYMLVDSDCFFNQPFNPCALLRDGLVPLYREVSDYYVNSQEHQKWHAVGRQVLGLPPAATPPATGYVGPHVFWRRDVQQQLRAKLDACSGFGGWINRIGRNLTFSEYVLYGIYADEVLTEAASGHYPYAADLCHNYWSEVPMTRSMMRFFSETTPPHKPMYMVNAKSKTAMALIREELAPWSL